MARVPLYSDAHTTSCLKAIPGTIKPHQISFLLSLSSPLSLSLFWLVGLLFFFFQDSVSLYSSDCPGIHYIDQTGLKLRETRASAS